MNKGKRAPVGAFDPNIDPMTGLPRGVPGAKQGANRSSRVPGGLADGSPVDEKSGARPGINSNGGRSRSATAPLVPSLSMHAEGSATELPSTKTSMPTVTPKPNASGGVAKDTTHSLPTSRQPLRCFQSEC